MLLLFPSSFYHTGMTISAIGHAQAGGIVVWIVQQPSNVAEYTVDVQVTTTVTRTYRHRTTSNRDSVHRR